MGRKSKSSDRLTERQQVARGTVIEMKRATQQGEAVAVTRAAGQREINRIWERTQAIIALAVVVAALAVGAYKAVTDPDAAAFTLLSGLANLVIGFYFGRTTPRGGSGDRATDER